MEGGSSLPESSPAATADVGGDEAERRTLGTDHSTGKEWIRTPSEELME